MTRSVRVAVTFTIAGLGLGALEVLLARTALAQWRLLRSPGPASLDEALTFLAAVVAVALGAWLALTTTAAVAAHTPGRVGAAADRWAQVWSPQVSRRVAGMLVGATVGGALAPGTALGDGAVGATTSVERAFPGFGVTAASPGFHITVPEPAAARGTEPAGTAGSDGTPEPGWTPSRPLQRPQAAPGLVTSAGGQHGARDIVVHRGDTLWDLVARHLGPGASDAEVATAWPAWHRANREVIGADPDLLLPGQVLRAPATTQGAAR